MFQAPAVAAVPAPRHDGVRVTVTLAAGNQPRLSNAAVVLTSDDESATGDDDIRADDVAIRPDGSFVFTNVRPGAYKIHARAGIASGPVPLVALHRIVVQQDDVHVTLTLLPSATLSGRVAAERQRHGPSFAGVRVRASSADGSAFGDAVAADVLTDGSFSIHGVTAGHHALLVEGLAEPWVLESVTHRGQDVTDSGVDVGTGRSIDDLRIAITTEASEVTGTVRDSEGQGVSGATVLLIPSAREFWTRVSRRLGRTITDADGRYRCRGLPAGEYRVAAAMLELRDAYRPERLRELSAGGIPLSLGRLAHDVIDLRLMASGPQRPAR